MAKIKRGAVRDQDGDGMTPKGHGRVRGQRRVRKKAFRLKTHREGPPFGRSFFEAVLPAMVQSCECTDDHEPQVLVHLGDGTMIDVHRVIGLGDRFAVLSVFQEGPGEDGIERTSDDLAVEAIPFDLVLRATVRRVQKKKTRRFGFSVEPAPAITIPKVEDRAPGPPPS
jgi:hypothetical protein